MLGIGLTGPNYENVPVNSCPDDDPPGEPRPLKAVPVNDMTPLVDFILASEWYAAEKRKWHAEALRLAAQFGGNYEIHENVPADYRTGAEDADFFWRNALEKSAARIEAGDGDE